MQKKIHENFNFNFRSEGTNNASAFASQRTPTRFDAGWTDEGNPKFLSYIRDEWLVPPSHRRANISPAGQKKIDFSQAGQSSFVDKVCHKNHCNCLEDSGLSLALVHVHVKMNVGKEIVETTRPLKHVNISEN